MSDIEAITSSFGEVYREVKGTKTQDGWEKILKDAQKDFFDVVTQELEQSTLARKTVEIPPVEDDVVEDWVRVYFPGWRFIEINNGKALIEEDPKLKSFAYLNMSDGMVYKRSQTSSGPTLDVEALQEADEDLYWQISEWPLPTFLMIQNAMRFTHNPDLITDFADNAHDTYDSLDWSAVETKKFLTEYHSDIRVIKDPSEWTPEQATALKPYLIPGKISVRLTPPRPAKPSELETGEVEEI